MKKQYAGRSIKQKIICSTLPVIVFLVIFAGTALGQKMDTLGCAILDFETIPGETPVEGLLISTQFFDSLGISFSLENGELPRLAKVGAPATAFGGAFGPDTPAPGQNIGSFFLTDDGVLSGLNAPPLIVNFAFPIDTASGRVLDIDFDETFTVEARDSSGQILEQVVIMAGDPGTGDAIATFWSFNRDTADIYSIRFVGTRNAPGAFGLGFDNFTTCAPGRVTSVEASVIAPTYLPQNCSITAKVKVDMTRAASPDNLLGSFDGTLNWDPALLQYTGDSGLLSGFTGSVNNIPGQITFSGANSNGAGGEFDILDVYFDVIGPTGILDSLNLDFSSMTAAFTSSDLLNILTLTNKYITLIEEGLLGDVNVDDLVNSTDALIMLSYDVGTPLPQVFLDRITYGFGDVNFSGETNSTDALIVLSYDVGIPVPYPVGELFCPPAPTLAPLLSAAKLPARKGEEIIASSHPVNEKTVVGNIIDIPLLIDMSQTSEKLGSFTATLEWDPAVLQLVSYTGGSAEGFETPVVNDQEVANGKLTVANANPYGAAGVANILNLQFKAIGEPGSITSVAANFSALAAATTFTVLLPYLNVSGETIKLIAEAEQLQTYQIDNFPNPFNPSTTISYRLPQAAEVELTIYNVLGQQVRALVKGQREAGNHQVVWDGRNDAGAKVGSGIYIYRFEAGEYRKVNKVILMK